MNRENIIPRIAAIIMPVVILLAAGPVFAQQQGPPVKTMPFTEGQPPAMRSVPFLVQDLSNPTAPTTKVVYVQTKDLEDRLSEFIKQMGQTFQKVPASVGQYSVEQIELSVSITAEGSVVVATVGAQAGIAVTFKRNSSMAPGSKGFK